jgi:hypothetical protein
LVSSFLFSLPGIFLVFFWNPSMLFLTFGTVQHLYLYPVFCCCLSCTVSQFFELTDSCLSGLTASQDSGDPRGFYRSLRYVSWPINGGIYWPGTMWPFLAGPWGSHYAARAIRTM